MGECRTGPGGCGGITGGQGTSMGKEWIPPEHHIPDFTHKTVRLKIPLCQSNPELSVSHS